MEPPSEAPLPDPKPPDASPETTPTQPSKKAKATSISNFSGQADMEVAMITARRENTDTEMETPEKNQKLRESSNEGTEGNQPGRASYKDSVLGNEPMPIIPDGDDLMSDESDCEEAEDDLLCPMTRLYCHSRNWPSETTS
ncbi:unnamed protein product [Linum trigynum]|uniref:Uncharacterized protein n=1 Tax=Linum trigynum TaxID=586398 RepID=A0AAV2DGZ8_9ROSI